MSPRALLGVLGLPVVLASCGGSEDVRFAVSPPPSVLATSGPQVVGQTPSAVAATARPSRTPTPTLTRAPSATPTRTTAGPSARVTTAAPTTARPTTAGPTTARPTTARPTTARPTSARPTTARPTAPSSARVSMGENFFSPRTVTVARGGTVTTSNDGRIDHDWVGPFWDSDNMEPGDTFTVTFPNAGSFDYVCTYHGGMTGTVTVT